MKLTHIAGFIVAITLVLTLAACVGDSSSYKNLETANKDQTIKLVQVGRYQSGIFDKSAAEIVTYDYSTKQTFVVNANSGKVDVLNSADISLPTFVSSLHVAADIGDNAGSANSVDVYNGLLAVAMDNIIKTNNGWIAFYKTADLSFIKKIAVGSLPDMVVFSPNGKKLVVAIEASPDEGYINDPNGQVAVINIDWDGTRLTTNLTNIDFTDFNVGEPRHNELPANLILSGIGSSGKASVAADLEPEYIVINKNSTRAFVALQENNGIAVINLTNKTVKKIYALGFKDHSLEKNALDIKSDGVVNIATYPIKGMYMPDSIAIFEKNGNTYLLTANEGDDRDDWLEGYANETNCKIAGYYFSGGECKDTLRLSRLDRSDMTIEPGSDLEIHAIIMGDLRFSYQVTKQMNGGNATNIATIYSYGARSFSIWNMEDGSLVWDSGKFFETKTAELYGVRFNNDNDENANEGRGSRKGPEPEAIAVGVINGKAYAFIGLERMGGIMVYEITDPTNPQFVQYLNNRMLDIEPKAGVDAGDLGPEGFEFVSADKSPSGKPLLIVGNEVSGSTTFYEIRIE